MATTTTITKMLFRRGNDSDRQQTILASGEPGWALDTKRLWIGDGVTPGGYPALSGADQHLRYVDASGHQGAGPQKLDINIHGLSASLVGDGEYDRSVHGTDRTIATDYPLQFSTISSASSGAIYYNAPANSEFLINRTNGGTINIGNAVYIDLDESGNGSVRFAATETTFEATKLVFAESDITVYEDKTIDLNVNVINGEITDPGIGGTSEKTGLYFGHKNYLSAGHVSVGHVGDDTGWSTIQIQPPVYENDWLSGEAALISRFDRPSNTTSSWVSDGMNVGSGYNACKPLVLKSARPSVYSGNADLVFETGLLVYGEGATDIGGWNGYLINQSIDSGAHPTFTGITIENTDGTPGAPMNVRSGGTGNNGFDPGGVILSHTTSTTGALSSLVLKSGELITGSTTGAKATKFLSNTWLNVTSDDATGVITIDNRLVPAANYISDGDTVTDYFNKWYNVATNTGNVNPANNKTSIEFVGDGVTKGSTNASDVNISTSTIAGNKIGINHKLHASTLWAKSGTTVTDNLATFAAPTRDAINSITFNKAGHITDIGTFDPGDNYLELDHVGTQAKRSGGSVTTPPDVSATASASTPNPDPSITQNATGHATVVTGLTFNDYGTLSATSTHNLKDSYYSKKEIGGYVHGLNADIVQLQNDLTTAQFLKLDASSATTGSSLISSWRKKGKIGFSKASTDVSFISQQDAGFTFDTLTDITFNLPAVTSTFLHGAGKKLEIKHGSDVAAKFENKDVSLYHDNIWRIKTTDKGVEINTECHATSFHGNGSNLDLSNNTSITDGDFVKKSTGGQFLGEVLITPYSDTNPEPEDRFSLLVTGKGYFHGRVSSSSILTGDVTATGKIQASGNIKGLADIIASGDISANGDISGTDISASGDIAAVGAIFSGAVQILPNPALGEGVKALTVNGGGWFSTSIGSQYMDATHDIWAGGKIAANGNIAAAGNITGSDITASDKITGTKLEIKAGAKVVAKAENKDVSLYYDGTWRMKTTTLGVEINTQCHATSFHGNGTNLDLAANSSITGIESAIGNLTADRLIFGEEAVKCLATDVGIWVTGTVRASSDIIAFATSDKRLKDNLNRISDPLEKISKISGYEFDWNDKQDIYTGHDVGVVAQEVEQIMPEVVSDRDDGYKAVKYEKLVPLLIESIKELTARVKELESRTS